MSQKTGRNVTEQFVEESMEELKASLSDIFKLEINKSIDVLKTNIINQLVEENKRLSRKCKSMSDNIDYLHEEIDDLHDKLYNIECGVHDSQQRSRRNNFEISGISNNISVNDLESKCVEILNNIVQVRINPNEIDACHRLQSKGHTKPVIIRMLSRKRTLEIKENKSKLSEIDYTQYNLPEHTKLYINDNLSPFFKTIAYYCRVLKRERLISKFKIEDAAIKVQNSSGKG